MKRCKFDEFKQCVILKVKNCSQNCKFRKTEEEYYEANKRAEEILRLKGLERVIKKTGEGLIISTTEVQK